MMLAEIVARQISSPRPLAAAGTEDIEAPWFTSPLSSSSVQGAIPRPPRQGWGLGDAQLHGAVVRPESERRAFIDVAGQAPRPAPSPHRSRGGESGPLVLADLSVVGGASVVAAIRELLRDNHVAAARRMLDVLPSADVADPALSRLHRVLAVPVTRPSARRDVDRTAEYRWLREHGREHPNRWVAIDGDALVASAATLRELRQSIRRLDLPRPPLIHRL